MGHLDDVCHHHVEWLREKEISTWCGDPVLISQRINELINRAGSLDLCEGVAVLVIHGKHLAVEHDLHVRIAAGASGPQLVGALNCNLPELENWIFCKAGVITSTSESYVTENVCWLAT
jgi:hypothetical protein